MLIRTAILALVAMLGLFGNTANAASHQEMASIRLMITDPKIPVLRRVDHMFGTRYYGSSITFVEKGLRYTIYSANETESRLPVGVSFWVRKDGTSGQKNMDTFFDMRADGIVDFGIDGPRNHMYNEDGEDSYGLQFKPFWQAKLDAAVKATLEYRRRVTSVRAPAKKIAKKR